MANTIPPWIDLISGDEIVSNCEVQDDGSVLIKDSKVTIPCSTYGEVCKVSGTEVVTETKSANFDLNVGDLVYSVRTYNKVLTTEQKTKNAALDKKRFKYIPSAKSYVKDGLVFQIDCSQKPTINGSIATLTDLASGIVLSGNASSVWHEDDGSLTLNKFVNETAVLQTIEGQYCTIEFIVKTNNDGYFYQNFIAKTNGGGISMYCYYGSENNVISIAERDRRGSMSLSKKSNTLKCVSGFSYGADENKFYEDDTERTMSYPLTPSFTPTIIAIELENIFSFRIYNRVLTDAERQRNYLIDQARFAIPTNALYDDNGNLLYDDSGNLLVSDN